MAEETVESLRASLVQANARAEEAERMRDAYRKAKSENDERFLGERDLARQERDTERAARVKAEAERDEAGRLLGVVVCAGTLAPGERLKDAPAHAAVSAIIGMAEQRDMYVRLYAGQLAKIEVESVEAAGRLAAAEAEVKRLRSAYDDPTTDATDGAHPAWWRGSDAGVAGAVRIVNEALDGPLPLPGCVGGADLEAVRQRVATLRASVARLVEAGDRLRYRGTDPVAHTAWAAAKAQVKP